MPDRDGLDLAKAINEDTTIPRPVLMLLTSRGEKLPHRQLESHQFAACELKPIHAKSLHETIGRVLANARPLTVTLSLRPERSKRQSHNLKKPGSSSQRTMS